VGRNLVTVLLQARADTSIQNNKVCVPIPPFDPCSFTTPLLRSALHKVWVLVGCMHARMYQQPRARPSRNAAAVQDENQMPIEATTNVHCALTWGVCTQMLLFCLQMFLFMVRTRESVCRHLKNPPGSTRLHVRLGPQQPQLP
jgi:hypothetical protein